MEVLQAEDLGIENETNLCDSCENEFATCGGMKSIIFVTGVGNDNVIACSLFNAISHK